MSKEVDYKEIGLHDVNPEGYPFTYYTCDWVYNVLPNISENSKLIITDTNMQDGEMLSFYTKLACKHDLSPWFDKGRNQNFQYIDYEKLDNVIEKIKELEKIRILSVEECMDKDYGESLVQYSLGENHVSFAFCSIDVSDKEFELNSVKEEVLGKLKEEFKQPLWSDLSETLRNEIIESEFDMRFIEYNDDYWTEEKAETVWDEAASLGLDSAVTCGENDCYITIYAGAMGKVNWSGHPVFGEPYLENIIVSPERLKEIKEQKNTFEYQDQFGDINYVQFIIDMYLDNDNLYLGLVAYDPEMDAMSPYGDVTVNTTVDLPYLYSTIDTNNNGTNLIPFLIENGFGELTDRNVRSGYCTFPVFKFSEEKLMEIFPKEFETYKKAYEKSVPLDKKIKEVISDESRNSGSIKEKDMER